jgi:serine/threonine protein kinase
MSLEAGRELLHYRLVAEIGEGGMGQVWRAVDTTLDRDVAIKVLPRELSSDVERLARFEREAKLLASLNHPNIAAVYGFQEADGIRFIVMELVEGEDLEAKLERGPLPVDDAIEIARRIAEALEAAHDQGVIHRDLKPPNVRLTADGKVKVLDFGLAKALESTRAGTDSGNPAESPTLTSLGTVAGVILGTAAYMSPEQAKGKAADRRADVWAFGTVLWEMLTGRRLFQGETISDTMAAVLREEIDWTALPRTTPRAVVHLLRRCLDRDRQRRLQAIGEARIALEGGFDMETEQPAAVPATLERPWRSARLAWMLLVPSIVLGALVGLWLSPEPPARFEIRAVLPPPDNAEYFLGGRQPGPVAVSPDGRRIVFAARDEAREIRLWVRPLDEETARPLPGTENASYPFWSPDGRSIAFYSGGMLRRIDTDGGPVLTLCPAPFGKGGSWNRDGVIVFAPSYNTGIYRVPAEGGEPEPLTELDPGPGDNSHRFPVFLPDGRRFLFLARRTSEEATQANAVMVGSIDGSAPRDILQAPTNVALTAGHLLYMRETVLLARRFDVDALRFEGDPYPIAENVSVVPGAAYAVFGASRDGVLVFERGGELGETLMWLDFEGNKLARLGEPSVFYTPDLSPDGTRIAVTREDPGGKQDVWVYDAERGTSTRVTSGRANSRDAIWMPDGKRLIYRTRTNRAIDLYSISAEGVGTPELLLATEGDKQALSVSPDGKRLLFQWVAEETGFDLWVLPLDDGEPVEPRAYLVTPYDELEARFSPDGNWVAYESNESGRSEVYIGSFPEPTRVRRVSTAGGQSPRWTPDGRRLLYATPTGAIYAAAVEIAGTSLTIRTPELLFDVQYPIYEDYDADDDRILLAERETFGNARGLVLVLDWQRGEAERAAD